MDNTIVITIRTIENLQLDSENPVILKEHIENQVCKLLDDDDPQLVGYEAAALEDYQALDRKWSAPAYEEVDSYTYISVTKEFEGNYPLEGFRAFEAEIIEKVIGQFRSGLMEFHSLSVKRHRLFNELHLRFKHK